MNKYLKAGLLMFTLVVPVLIFLFLKGFTTNRFDVPYYVPQVDPVTKKVLVREGDTVFYQLPAFTLLASEGKNLSSQELMGKTLVVHTLDAPCGDTCQKVMRQLTRVSAMYEAYPELRLLTVVNGDKAQYASEDTKTPAWQILSVPDSLYRGYADGVFRLSEKIGEGQTILPNTRLELIDQNGFIRGYYNALDPEEIDRLMVEIKILEYNRKQED